jgi:hypothetical protein
VLYFVELYSHFTCCRSHVFDEIKKKTKSQRKSAGISDFFKPGRGAAGVRVHHKVHEEKILAHRRLGYTDEEIEKELNLSQDIKY